MEPIGRSLLELRRDRSGWKATVPIDSGRPSIMTRPETATRLAARAREQPGIIILTQTPASSTPRPARISFFFFVNFMRHLSESWQTRVLFPFLAVSRPRDLRSFSD